MSVRWWTHSGFSVRSGFIHKWKTKAPNTYWCSKNMNPSNVVCYHNVHPHSNSKCAWGVLFLGELTPYVGFQWHGAPVGSHVWTQPRVSSSPGEVHMFAEHHWDVAWGWRKWCPRICRTGLSVKHWKSPCIFHLQWQKRKTRSFMLRNTQELCLTPVALRNTGVHDLCISSEIFTPHWGAKRGKWSVTNVAPFNAACEGTQHDEKNFQQPDSCPMCSGAHMLTDCPLACLVLYIHRVGGLSPLKCLILFPVNIGGICLWE